MPETPPLPRGLVFFPPSEEEELESRGGIKRRQRRWVFLVILALAVCSLTWPVYPLFAAFSPQILGLPLSLAWVVLWLLVVFGALLWLFLSEESNSPQEPS